MKPMAISEAARRLQCSSRTIANMLDDGRLRGERSPLGRLADEADVERLVRERAEHGGKRAQGARTA
jgi:excisionase family DNA binding protein